MPNTETSLNENNISSLNKPAPLSWLELSLGRSLPVPLSQAEKPTVEMAKFGRQTCLLHKLCFRQNPIINFHPANRPLCNSIPHKVNTTFHLISSVSRMSLTFFRPQLITVIHWIFFFQPQQITASAMQADPSGPVLKHQLLRCVKTVWESFQALYWGIYLLSTKEMRFLHH